MSFILLGLAAHPAKALLKTNSEAQEEKTSPTTQVHTKALFVSCHSVSLRSRSWTFRTQDISRAYVPFSYSPPGLANYGHGLNPGPWLFLYVLWAKNGFKMVAKKIFCDMWKWYEIQILVPINKVLLEHSHALCLYIVHGCFGARKMELSSCDRDGLTCKLEIFTLWPFTERICWPLFSSLVVSSFRAPMLTMTVLPENIYETMSEPGK